MMRLKSFLNHGGIKEVVKDFRILIQLLQCLLVLHEAGLLVCCPLVEGVLLASLHL